MSIADVGDFYVGGNYNVEMNTIGERIRKARMMKDLTQQDVADYFGIARVSVTQWENGTTQPGKDKLTGLADLLGGSPEWYLDGRGQMPISGVLIKKLDEDAAKSAKNGLISTFDPDEHHQEHHEEGITFGSETGLRGAPEGSSPQIDITAGMGAGGLSITNEGVLGKHGMTFSAESVKDYWKLPPAILVTLGLAAKDIAIFPVQGDSMLPTLDEGDVVFIDTRHRRPSPDGLYAIIDEIGGLAIKRLEITSDPGADEALVSVISDNPRHKAKVWKANELYIVGRVLRKFSTVR